MILLRVYFAIFSILGKGVNRYCLDMLNPFSRSCGFANLISIRVYIVGFASSFPARLGRWRALP